MIIDESAKMNKMVKQLLTLNQLESGGEQLAMECFDLAELIRGVIQSSHILIEQKKARILFSQETPVPVWGDEFKIEEVVTNYLTNALNHPGRGAGHRDQVPGGERHSDDYRVQHRKPHSSGRSGENLG